MAQLELPFGETRHSGFLPSRSEPVVWISRVLLLRALSMGAVIRDIRLRRGLNILWARPTETAEPRLNEGGLSGHTAGKTTFCRLLRYLLGEQRFAAPRVQERIRLGPLRDGWVLGEVFVRDERWIVGRPFALHVHPFAVRGGSVEEAIEKGGPFQDFLDALAGATMRDLPAKWLPSAGRPLDWPVLLTWLARDQEARFAAIDEWRSPRSESDSPSPPAIDRATVLRSVLGVVSDSEGQLQHQWEELDKAKDSIERAAADAHVRGADRRQRLAERLSIAPDTLEDGALFVHAAQAEVEQRRREAHGARATILDLRARLGEAETAKDEAASAHAELLGQVKAFRKSREANAIRMQAVRSGRTPPAEWEGSAPGAHSPLDSGADPGPTAAPGRCNVPLAVARERGCPLAVGARVKAAPKGDIAPPETPEIGPWDDLDAEIEAAEKAALGAQQVAREKREAYVEAAELLSDVQSRASAKESALREAEELLREARAAEKEASAIEEKRRERAAKMADVTEKQAALRRIFEEERRRLSDRFDGIIRALLGDNIQGRVDVKRDGIEVVAIAQGDRESAALDTIKVLAFDLAALSLGFEGHGHFPGLLIHDGPREADLDQAVYDRLFLLALQMEDAFGLVGSIGFQYIVTTTTPPPLRVRREPWLLDPILDASVEEGRLLKMNL